MTAFLRCLVILFVLSLFHRPTDAVSTADENRVLITFNRSYDNCRDVTDTSGHEATTAADKECERAFQSLDRVGLNGCFGWRNPACRLMDGEQYAQCTCTISYSDDDSIKSDIVTTFRDCVPVLRDWEDNNGFTPPPMTNFQEIRNYHDDRWRAAILQPNHPLYNLFDEAGSSGALYPDVLGTPGGVYTSGGASSSNAQTQGDMGGSWEMYISGYEDPSSAQPSQARGESSKRPRKRGRGRKDSDKQEEKQAKRPKNFACDECNNAFGSARALYEHKKAHHTLCDTHCYICNQTFPFRRAFTAHLRSRHPVEAQVDAASVTLSVDLAEEETIMPHICTFCPKRFTNLGTLNAHLKSHTTDWTKCISCDRTFSTMTTFRKHMKNVHPGVPIPKPAKDPGTRFFPCSQCSKEYTSLNGLKQHEKSHKTTDTYCSLCKKILSTKHGYKEHIQRKHPKVAISEKEAKLAKYIAENPFKCEQCDKRFKNERGLRTHMQLHDGKTKCDVCNLVLPRRDSLLAHKKKEHPK